MCYNIFVMILKKASFFFAFLGLLFSCAPVSAQSIPGIQNPLVVSVIPNEPRSNEAVFIRLQSFSMDLDRSLVTWYVDGVSVSSGVGLKDFSVKAGGLGSTKIIDVTVAPANGGSFTETITIRPADVGLVWESDTYSPPFYKGKALHSYNGSFRVIAVPEMFTSTGIKIDPKDLIYTWKKNGEVEGSASGYGKNVYIGLQTSYLREGEDISVEVSAPRDNVVAANSILITPTVPNVILYEKSPLYGIVYEKALQNRTELKNEEITIIAEPFFFSVPRRNTANLTYAWSLNDSALTDFANKSSLTLRKTLEQAGRANLSVVLQNTLKLLQGGKSNLTISYE